ncbi:MAG: ferredoxin family protein [Nanoarchaeota archaeon]
MTIKIDAEKCKGCKFCVITCPLGIIEMSTKLNKKGYYYAEVKDEKKCSSCGLCFQMCPDLCIEIQK